MAHHRNDAGSHDHSGDPNSDQAHGTGDDHGHPDTTPGGEHGHDQAKPHEHEHEHPTGLRGRFKELYRPHSHDAADSFDSALESSERGIKAVKISLAALLVTAILQVFVVLLTGSVALLADTIHNFSDALTSIPLWIAFVIGRRAATRSYTFGYRRAEDLAGLFIIAMIALSAFLAGWESIRRIVDPIEVENLPLLAVAGVIGFMGNELVALYRIRVGTQIGSAALVADGHHARTDGLTSLAVVFGALGVWLGFPLADSIVGLLITVAILFVLRDAMRQVFRRLMDGVDPETTDQIETVVMAIPGVVATDSIRARWMGHRLDVSLHVMVNGGMTVTDGHAISEEVRHALLHDIPKLEDVTVHIDPDGVEDHHGVTRHHADRRGGTTSGAARG